MYVFDCTPHFLAHARAVTNVTNHAVVLDSRVTLTLVASSLIVDPFIIAL